MFVCSSTLWKSDENKAILMIDSIRFDSIVELMSLYLSCNEINTIKTESIYFESIERKQFSMVYVKINHHYMKNGGDVLSCCYSKREHMFEFHSHRQCEQEEEEKKLLNSIDNLYNMDLRSKISDSVLKERGARTALILKRVTSN